MQLEHFTQSLADYAHLLPTQQDVLQRVLFQLTFNDLKQFAIVGVIGSGKTTLSLVLAEVLSTEHNVALLAMVQSRTELEQQLLTQWLGANQAAHIGFEQALHHLTSAGQPLVLLVDNFQQFSLTEQQWLLSLPVSLCCFCETPLASAQLNITINHLTLADAQQLLQHEHLEPLLLAGRLASSQSNIRLLLDPLTTSPQRSTVKLPLSWQYLLPVIAMILLVLTGIWIWLSSDKDTVIVAPSAAHQHLTVNAVPSPEEQLDQSFQSEPDNAVLQHSIEVAIEPATPELHAEPISEQFASKETFSDDKSALVLPLDTDSVIELDKSSSASAHEDTAEIDAVSTEPLKELSWPADEALLLDSPASMVALQFAVLSDLAAVERFEQQYPELIFYRYQRSWQGRLQWVLLSELQADNAAAQRLITTLPVKLQSEGPFVKRLSPVKQEIKALQRLREYQGLQYD